MAEDAELTRRARAHQLLEVGETRSLSVAETEELGALLERFPGLEFEAFTAELAEVDRVPEYVEAVASKSLRGKVLRAAGDSPQPSIIRQGVIGQGSAKLRRRIGLIAASVGLVLAGAFGQGVIAEFAQPKPPTGPPGTLGAVEQIVFEGQPAGWDVDASVVAHTWGTETMMEIGGLPVGEQFTAVIIGADGTEFSSGGMIGSAKPVDCQLNAAVLRPDATQLQVRDQDGDTVMTAQLPAAR